MLFRISILIFSVSCAASQHFKGNISDCVEKYSKSKPHLLVRFERKQLAWLCQRSQEWLKQSLTPSLIAQDDLITRPQRLWLDSLRSCKGKECLKAFIKSKCRGSGCQTSTEAETGSLEDEIDADILTGTINKTNMLGQFQSLDINTLNKVQPFRITRELDSPLNPDDLKLSSEAVSQCNIKEFLAQICPQALKAATLQDLFPNLMAIRRNPFIKEQNQKFRRIQSKCRQLEGVLQVRGKDFAALDNCKQNRAEKTSNMAKKCMQVLNNQADSLFQSRGQKKRWASECNGMKSKLEEHGMKMEDLIINRNTLRNVRRRPVSKQGIQDLQEDILSGGNGPFDDTGDLKVVRKEIRMLSDAERQRFHQAMNRLKVDKIDTMNKYDLLVVYHTPQESPGAHYGPAFLPFHRELLKQLEIALRTVDPSVSVPYWDTTLDEGLPEAKDSILWTQLFFGNGDGPVTTGPYANWDATHELSFVPGMRKLFRDVGSSPFGGHFKEADVDFTMSRRDYRDLTSCVDPTFELVHGLPHMFVGGFMADIGISPNDPTFFLHHCFIDHLWEQFRTSRQSWDARETDYPSQSESCSSFHYANNPMQPFPIRNIDGLSNTYTQDMYTYQSRPKCSRGTPDCGSPYLYCDVYNERCLSKIRMGGNCTNFEGTDICYNGGCIQGLCRFASPTRPPVRVTTTHRPVSTSTQWWERSTTTSRPWTTSTQWWQRPTTPPPTTTTRPWTTTTQWWETSATTPRPWWETTTKTSRTTRTIRPTTTTRPWTTASRPWTTTTHPWTTTRPWTTARPWTTRRPWTTARPPTTTSTATLAPETPVPWWQTTTEPWEQTTSETLPTTTRRKLREEVNPTSARSNPVVYFTVTIQRGLGYYKEPVPFASVKTYGLNVPTGYTETMQGTTMDYSYYPSYSGAAVVKVRDPEMTGYFSIVDAAVEVRDERDRLCQAKCYAKDVSEYKDCSSQIRLSTNSYYSDPIQYRHSEEEALESLWDVDNRRRTRRRKPDYLIFQCPR